MAIKIYSDTFNLFYNELFTKFQRLIPFKTFKKYPADDYNQWSAPRLKSDELIFTSLFSPELTSPLYWYNRKSKAENSELGYCEVKPTVLIKGLRFLKIKMPTIPQIKNDTELKAKVLFQFFLENVEGGKELLETHPDLIVYDHASNDFIEHTLTDAKVISYNPDLQPELKTVQRKSEDIETQLNKFINDCFNLVNQGKFDELWKIFTPSFLSTRWELNFDAFLLHFNDTIEFQDARLFNFLEVSKWNKNYGLINPSRNIIFSVSYTEKQHPPKHFLEELIELYDNKSSDELKIKYYKKWIMILQAEQSLPDYENLSRFPCKEEYYKRWSDIFNKEYDRVSNFSFSGVLNIVKRDILWICKKFLSIFNSDQSYDNIYRLMVSFRACVDKERRFSSGMHEDKQDAVYYDKLEQWQCVLSNNEWFVHGIDVHSQSLESNTKYFKKYKRLDPIYPEQESIEQVKFMNMPPSQNI